MCRLDETWHVTCGHWGHKRNVSPCAIGLSNPSMLLLGCWHSTTEGCSRVNTQCPSCRFREERRRDISLTGKQEERAKYPLETQQQSEDDFIRGMTIHGFPETDRIWLQRRLGLCIADGMLAEKFWEEQRKPGEKEKEKENEKEERENAQR